jgi:hypothetical protein
MVKISRYGQKCGGNFASWSLLISAFLALVGRKSLDLQPCEFHLSCRRTVAEQNRYARSKIRAARWCVEERPFRAA